MATGILEKDLIPQPHLWKLGLGIEARSLEVVLCPPVNNESIIHKTIALDPTKSQLKAVEDAVYENPLLLNDFKAVMCVSAGEKFLAVPPEVGSERKLIRKAFETLNPLGASCELIARTTSARNATIVTGIDEGMYGFLRRSFYNSEFSHPMVSLIDHVCSLAAETEGAETMMLVVVGEGKVDVVCVGAEKLLIANSFRITAPIDAAYYVMSARKQLGIEADSPVRLAGPVEQRRQLGDILRPYLSDVKDLGLPSRLWQSGAPALTAPLYLLLLPLTCA